MGSGGVDPAAARAVLAPFEHHLGDAGLGTISEIVEYEALGLCPIGQGGKFALDGRSDLGGYVVVNPRGGRSINLPFALVGGVLVVVATAKGPDTGRASGLNIA